MNSRSRSNWTRWSSFFQLSQQSYRSALQPKRVLKGQSCRWNRWIVGGGGRGGKMVHSRRVSNVRGLEENKLSRWSAGTHVSPDLTCSCWFSFHFISFLILFPPHCLALDNKISFKLRHKTRYPFQLHFLLLSSPVPFNFPFSYTTGRLVHSDNNTQLTQPYTLPFYIVSGSPSSLTPSLFNPHYRHPRGHPTTVADKSIAHALTTKKMAHAFKILHINLHRNCISRCIYILIIRNEWLQENWIEFESVGTIET